MAHEQFDRLTGIDSGKRSREDRLPMSLLTTVEKCLDESGADELAQWSHAYLDDVEAELIGQSNLNSISEDKT